MAKCWIETFAEQKALVVKRFNRRLATDGSWYLRLPQEDLYQATATPPGLAKMGFLSGSRYPLHDRDARFYAAFDGILKAAGLQTVRIT